MQRMSSLFILNSLMHTRSFERLIQKYRIEASAAPCRWKWKASRFGFIVAFRRISASRLIDPGSHKPPQKWQRAAGRLSCGCVGSQAQPLSTNKGKSYQNNPFFFWQHQVIGYVSKSSTSASAEKVSNKLWCVFTLLLRNIFFSWKTPGAVWHSDSLCYGSMTLLHKLC